MGLPLNCFNILREILTGVGALPGARGAGDVEYLFLLGCIGYVLELAVVGYIELSKLLNETVLVFVVGVAREVVPDTLTIIPLYFPHSILARGRPTLFRLSIIYYTRK